MTAPAPDLAAFIQAEPGLMWQPSGDEPQPCDITPLKDPSRIGDVAWKVTFTLPGQRALVNMWIYAAETDPGAMTYKVAYRFAQVHGSWAVVGWHSADRLLGSPQEAIDAALAYAVDLACGSFSQAPGGIPACLHWDGVPW
jgi:hypothetical protein